MIPRSQAEFHSMDYGTVIMANVRNGRNQRVDLSDAFAVEILFMRPDGSGFSRTAQLGYEDMFEIPTPVVHPALGSDGTLVYILQPADLDLEGNWHLQFYVELGGGAWYSSVVAFVVLPNIVSPGQVLTP